MDPSVLTVYKCPYDKQGLGNNYDPEYIKLVFLKLYNQVQDIKLSLNKENIHLKEKQLLQNKYALIYKEYKKYKAHIKNKAPLLKKELYKKYVYLVPSSGFNDILSVINLTVEYCRKNKRILMIDTRKSCYTFCFDEYFYFKNIDVPIITDIDTIETIFSDTTLTVYPDIIKNRDLKQFNFKHLSGITYHYNNIRLDLPYININTDIIVNIKAGNSGDSITTLKCLYFKQNIIDHVKEQYNKLPSPYLCIQVRNTDYKCDYVSLYETNKELINSYNSIYIATDDKDSLEFFRSKGLPIYNFTDFPSIPSINLHYSSVDPDIKIKNLICDIYIISMAEKLLTNSIGGFINLCKAIREDINMITDKIQ